MRRMNFLKSNISQKFCDYIQKYFAISNIHGFNHIVNTTAHLTEKIFWSILVSVAAFGGYVLSNMTLNRYYTNPIVISIERDRFSWTTPLPAITMCPVQRSINETALNEYLKTTLSHNKTHLRDFIVSLAYANYTNFEDVLENDEIPSEDYMSILKKVKFNLKLDVTLTGLRRIPSTWVVETVTEMGICYSFNSPLAVYSSYNYWKNSTWEIIPQFKNLEVHPLDGEVFAYIFNLTTDWLAYIHGPYEVVDIKSKPIYVSGLNYLELYLTAISIISSENTKQLSVNQRKCRFYYESNLLHFPVYTSVVCKMECRIFLAKKLCGCVPHFYRTLVKETTCNVKGLHCLAQHKERLILLEDECNCTANCEEVNYVVQEMKIRPTQHAFFVSTLQYGIKKFPDMRLKRDVLFGFSDVMVYIGGVMGLFLGFSLLSFVELLYYFTLRLFWVLVKKYSKQ